MARSSKKVSRLVDVFHDLETTERARISEITRQMDELRISQNDLIATLANPSAVHEPFLQLMSRSLGNIQRRLQRLSKEHEMALNRYVEATKRTRGAAALLADVRAEEARKAEQRDLEALLEFQQATAAQGRGKSTRSS
ncbi:hypothetical protein [Hyphomicrobium sp. 99]|uniref:hypothetical protein n=1 Tax=Hyphomicrobium sp. 99 TaxID=1163419 RepID=UPI0005F80DAB|nr:hypothetical protein [Hyphomicrobium sp. 99]